MQTLSYLHINRQIYNFIIIITIDSLRFSSGSISDSHPEGFLVRYLAQVESRKKASSPLGVGGVPHQELQRSLRPPGIQGLQDETISSCWCPRYGSLSGMPRNQDVCSEYYLNILAQTVTKQGFESRPLHAIKNVSFTKMVSGIEITSYLLFLKYQRLCQTHH